MGQIKLIASLFLIAVFSIAIVTYAVNYGTDNNAVVNLADDAEFSTEKTTIENNLGSMVVVTNDTGFSYSKLVLESGAETARGGGVLNALVGPIVSVKRILSLGQSKIFGNDTGFGVIFTSLSAFLIVLIILYGWKTWIGKNPD